MSRFENVDYSRSAPPIRAFGERLLGAATLGGLAPVLVFGS